VQNSHTIFQMAKEYTKHFHSKAENNLPQIDIFGLKIYHLIWQPRSNPIYDRGLQR
jgi:hypothetical protein